MIPDRKNSQTIDASWFNSLRDEFMQYESVHDLTDGQSATDLDGEEFDGEVVSSVRYEYEVQRSTTIFANGNFSLQYLNGTWRVADGGYEGEEHGLTFSVSQVGTVGQLKVASSSGPGAGSLKLMRRSFNA